MMTLYFVLVFQIIALGLSSIQIYHEFLVRSFGQNRHILRCYFKEYEKNNTEIRERVCEVIVARDIGSYFSECSNLLG